MPRRRNRKAYLDTMTKEKEISVIWPREIFFHLAESERKKESIGYNLGNHKLRLS